MRKIVAVFTLVPLLFLAACTRDPNVRKQKYLESGDRFYEQGKYREAALQYANALQVDSRFADAHYHLARVQLKTASWTNAYAELHRTVELDPNNLNARLDLGNLLLGAHDGKRAQEQADAILAIDSQNDAARALRASAYALQGKTDDAFKEFREALRSHPNNFNLLVGLGMLQMNNGKLADAEVSLKQAMDANPNSAALSQALAHLYETENKHSDAEQMLKRAIIADPKNISARKELADFYVKANDRADAEKTLREAASSMSDNPAAGRMLADYYVEQGDYERALPEYRQLQAKYPTDGDIIFSLVDCLLHQGQADEAQKINDKFLQKNKKNSDALVNQARIMMANKHGKDAENILRDVLKNDADSAVAHYQLGMLLNQTGRTAEAANEWRATLRINPRLIDALEQLGAADLTLKNEDEARAAGDRLAALMPNSPEGYIQQARVMAITGQLADADKAVARALELAPNDASAQEIHGEVLFMRRDYKGAEALFEKALTIDPNNVDAVKFLIATYATEKKMPQVAARLDAQTSRAPNNTALLILKGLWLSNAGDLPGADAAFQKALTIDPNSYEATLRLGTVQGQEKAPDRAIQTFEHYLSLNPGNTEMLMMLGTMYQAKGDDKNAEQTFHKVLDGDPDNPVAANNLAYIMLQRGDNADVALSLAQIARKGMPNVAATADTLGYAYYQKGVYRSAIDILEVATKQDPNDPGMQLHLGMAYARANDKAKARAHLQKALDLKPEPPLQTQAQKELDALGKS